MKVSDIIKESDNSTTDGNGNKETRKGKSGKVHDYYRSSVKGLETYTDNNSYYTMYRFGVDMARGTQEQHPYDPKSPIGNQLATVAYTDEEQKIIDNSKKNIGLKSKKLTSKNSVEQSDTYTPSPVANIKKNKYGV
jgi:hypothetical protein